MDILDEAPRARQILLVANSFVCKSDTPEKMFQRLRMLPAYWPELNRLTADRTLKQRRAGKRKTQGMGLRGLAAS